MRMENDIEVENKNKRTFRNCLKRIHTLKKNYEYTSEIQSQLEVLITFNDA